MKTEVEEEILSSLGRIEILLSKTNKPLNLVEAANHLSMSQSHLYRLTSQHKIPCHKPSGKYLYFFVDELDGWIKNSRQGSIGSRQEKASRQ